MLCSTNWQISWLPSNGDDAAAAGGDLLDVGEGFFVLNDAQWVVGVFGGDATTGKGLVDEGVGACFISSAWEASDSIAFATALIFFSTFSAQKSHVKSQNHLTHSNEITLRLKFS